MNFQFKGLLYQLTISISFASVVLVFSNAQESFVNTLPTQASPSKSEKSLTSAPPTPWTQMFNVTDDPAGRGGSQVLHSISNTRRHYTENEYAQDFVKQYCQSAKHLDTDADVLRFASDNANKEGEIIELGTGRAKTTQFLSPLNPKKKIHTFDSFNGLPEDWDKGSRIIKAGTFAALEPGHLPPVNNNVYIYVGEFKDTLPRFRDEILKDTPISLLNVDCDIYSSTKTAFDILGNNIVPGTVIYFDEGYNYPNYLQGEWKVLLEFTQRTGYNFEVIAFNEVHEQLAVRICR